MKIRNASSRISTLLLLIIFVAPAHAEQSEARRALTGKQVGIYAVVPWAISAPSSSGESDFLERTKKIDFSIRSVTFNSKTKLDQLPTAIKRINSELATAAKLPSKSMILRIDFWDDNERSRLNGPVQNVAVYGKRIASILDQIDWKSPALVGISLSEENMPGTNGRFDVLADLYKSVKDKYPGLPVYQWLIPNVSVPNVKGYGTLPADGWIINPYTLTPEVYPDNKYHLGPDPYLTILKQYLATGKPVIGVVWASNLRPHYFEPNNPQNKSGIDMWKIMDHQFNTNRANNVATAFYWGSNRGNGGISPRFSKSDSDPLMDRINTTVEGFADKAHH